MHGGSRFVSGFDQAGCPTEARMLTAAKRIGTLVVAVGLLAVTMPEEAWSRAGGGIRSGSGGSRSFSSPSRSSTAPSRPSAPSAEPSPTPTTRPVPSPGPAGGLWRSVAGGVLGGILGGMLFGSLGFAGGYGGLGGGFGLMDLLLLGGVGYLIYWVINRGQRSEEATATSSYSRMASEPHSYTGGTASMATAEQPGALGSEELNRGLGHIRQTDPHFDKTA